jgi:1,4-dihydroxy-2-naphthoate octaprenyltransferase
MGSILAAFHQAFDIGIFVMAVLTTVFLQILSNLANDYGDSVHGADNLEREGPIRAVQSGLISLDEMKKAVAFFSLLSLGCGLLLLYLAFNEWKLFLLFVGFGILAILAAITYTSGSKPYGYAGLGDVSVFLFFGILGVLGTYFLYTQSLDFAILLPAISLGLFSTAVLNINNIRDIQSDHKAGKKSIPVRIGRQGAVVYNWILILGGNGVMFLYILHQKAWGGLLVFLVLPLMVKVATGVAKKQNSSEVDPYLKQMAISTLLWAILFGIGLWIYQN